MFEKLKKNIETKKVNRELEKAGMKPTGVLEVDKTFAQMAKFSNAMKPTDWSTGKSFDQFMKDLREKGKMYNENYHEHWDDGIMYYALDTEDDIELRRLHKQLNDDWDKMNKTRTALVDELILDIGQQDLDKYTKTNNAVYEFAHVGDIMGKEGIGYFDYTTKEGLINIGEFLIYNYCNKTNPLGGGFCYKEITNKHSQLAQILDPYIKQINPNMGDVMLSEFQWIENVIQALLIYNPDMTEDFAKKGVRQLWKDRRKCVRNKLEALSLEDLNAIWNAYVEYDKSYYDENNEYISFEKDKDGNEYITELNKETMLHEKVEDQSYVIPHQKTEKEFFDILDKYDLRTCEYPNYEEVFKKYQIKDEYLTYIGFSKVDFAFSQKKYRTDDYLRLELRQDDQKTAAIYDKAHKERGDQDYPMTLGEIYAHYIVHEQEGLSYDMREFSTPKIEAILKLIPKYLDDDANLKHPTEEEMSDNPYNIIIKS